jgi:uncharacterized protein YqjF (DUF2071 family)
MVRVIDLHHGFNLVGLMPFTLWSLRILVTSTYFGCHPRLNVCFVKLKRNESGNLFRNYNRHKRKGLIVDGIKFNVRQLFKYIIHHF